MRSLERAIAFGTELVAASSVYRDAAIHQGKLWLITSASLWEYSLDGALLRQYRCGVDLPSAPLTGIAAATIGESNVPALYIATQGAGLVVFDGGRFQQLLPESPALRKITALLAMETGELIVGTEKSGALAWDGKRLRLYHETLRDLRVTKLAGGVDNLWVGTMDRGVFRLHAGQTDMFDESKRLPDAHVLSIAVSAERAWVGTAMGVAEFNGSTFQRVIAEGAFANALHAGDSSLLIGTMEEGVWEAPLAAKQPRPQRAGMQNEPANVVRFLNSGATVYTLFRDGLAARDARGGGWNMVTHAESAPLADANIAALAADDAGRLWVGYFDRGLDVLAPGSLRASHHEDEHLFCINRIVPTPNGAVIATANGLVTANSSGEPKLVMGRKEGLIADHVTDVLVDGPRIIAATPAGITFLDPGGPQSIYAFHGLVNNHVYALARSGNRIVAGTLGGVSVLDAGIVKANFTTSNSALRHNWISAMAAVGNEWFAGTYGAGIYRFDGAMWSAFPDLREAFEVNPNAMAATTAAVYAGTLGRGLAVFNRTSGRWGFHTGGLPSLNVTAVASRNGTLFVGTDNGLVRYEERSLPLP